MTTDNDTPTPAPLPPWLEEELRGEMWLHERDQRDKVIEARLEDWLDNGAPPCRYDPLTEEWIDYEVLIGIRPTWHRALIQAYQGIPDVHSIYADTPGNRAWVIMNNPVYDDALMDQLIAAYQQLLDLYPGLDISFPPLVLDPQLSFVSASAPLLWQRNE